MKQYLLDTNICIYFIKGRFELDKRFRQVGPENCFISEITLAELLFGVMHSEQKEKNRAVLDLFLSKVKVIPIFHALECYAEEKSRLRKLGQPIADFDLLIAASAVTHGLILVTNNTRHFKGIRKISLEDWTSAPQ
jgi:tRNA(fMet)-specific endonuclease VapC